MANKLSLDSVGTNFNAYSFSLSDYNFKSLANNIRANEYKAQNILALKNWSSAENNSTTA